MGLQSHQILSSMADLCCSARNSIASHITIMSPITVIAFPKIADCGRVLVARKWCNVGGWNHFLAARSCKLWASCRASLVTLGRFRLRHKLLPIFLG